MKASSEYLIHDGHWLSLGISFVLYFLRLYFLVSLNDYTNSRRKSNQQKFRHSQQTKREANTSRERMELPTNQPYLDYTLFLLHRLSGMCVCVLMCHVRSARATAEKEVIGSRPTPTKAVDTCNLSLAHEFFIKHTHCSLSFLRLAF